MPNRLALERSPYLRQHADNPVAWMPWGDEAFARAKSEDKPIFLSIGYSTCHWCHVMAHESFEDAGTASLLNEQFIPIKVDREERPDVDRVYMGFVQALAGQGGWPLSAWLTPTLKPFYGGTYFPPEDRQGRAGFPSVLKAIARGWKEDRKRLEEHAETLVASMRERVQGKNEGSSDGEMAERASSAFEACFENLQSSFDRTRGGFGAAPKFPRASNLDFLFRCAALQGLESEAGREATGMAAPTLRFMARGGIHDHVGGGFHRYSVDEEWFVPHFEKMLYDQAQIAVNALEAWQASGDARHVWLARDILDYVLRDMTDPQGGFYSAEDADSSTGDGGAHAEGAFYVWTLSEIDEILGKDTGFFCAFYNVQAEGNVAATRDPHGEFAGKNILAQSRPLADAAKEFGLGLEAASDLLASCLERLRKARSARPRPLRDGKVISAWNGLMISAFAKAHGVVLALATPAGPAPTELAGAGADGEAAQGYLRAAVRAAEFVHGELYDPKRGILFRVWNGGRGEIEGFAEDYAFLIQGLLDLYEACFDIRWLEWAERLQNQMDVLFWDAEGGGYFNSAAGAADIVIQLKEDYDGAEPAPSSVAAMNLLRLAAILPPVGASGGAAKGNGVGSSHGNGAGLVRDYRKRALRTLAGFETRWSEYPHALPRMLCALELALAPPRQVVLAGDPASADFQELAAVLSERLGPRRSVLAADGGPGQEWMASRAPWIAEMRPQGGRATAYVCEDFACQLPATSPEELRQRLSFPSR